MTERQTGRVADGVTPDDSDGAVASDIDATAQLENQASMLSLIAHDLRNPLFRIALSANLMADVSDVSVQNTYVRTILETISAMSRLIDDLDDYGSLRSGRLNIQPQRVHPSELLDAVVASFAVVAHEKSVTLSARTSGDLPTIMGDRDRLLQVLSNLVGNALQLTPAHGAVTLEASSDGAMVTFAVADTGPGIAPHDLPSLFERYWRGDHGAYAGRGLGLTIARALVEQHGGTIWAENRASGGARFTFRLDARHRSGG